MSIEKQGDLPREGAVGEEGEGSTGEVPFELSTDGCLQ